MKRVAVITLFLFCLGACRDTPESVTSDQVQVSEGRGSTRRSPVVVIGIDGADWYVMRQLVRDGEIPTIARLMANGAYGDLQTLSPTESPTIWTTIATGYTPERHGISGFVSVVPDSGATTLVSSTSRQTAALWNLASGNRTRVGVVNWWATFPAETVDGFVVSDRANLRRRFAYKSALGLTDKGLQKLGSGETYPSDLLPRILDIVKANDELPEAATKFLVDPMPSQFREEMRQHDRLVRDKRLSVLKFVALQDHASLTATRVAIAREGMPGLLLVYFSGLDAAEHQFWAYFEPHRYPAPPDADEVKAFRHVIPGYYRYVDTLVASLLQQLPSDSQVVLLSDHGHDANLYWDPKATIGDYAKWSMGNHGNAPPGILLFSGPGVQSGQVRRVSVYDVAPTVLALLGIQPSEDMPGRVITEAFTPEMRANLAKGRAQREEHRQVSGKPVASDVDAELLEKLKALGYIQ